jgi:TonB family protein
MAPPAPEPDMPPRRRAEGWRDRLPGAAGSLGLHLAVLLAVLFGWRMPAPVERPPIPVRIVFQPPPVPKPPPRQAAKRLARGPIASEDFGDTNPQDLGPVNRQGAAASRRPLALDAPGSHVPAPPKPAAIKTAAVPRPPEKPRPPAPRAARRPSPPRRMTVRLAKYPGPAATKSEYLAYLVALTRQHLDLLPLSLIGGRRGETVVGVLVLDDGRIAMIKIVKSSGYPDIDERVERMIAAVGRFPPLPQWFQGPSMPIEFTLRFPGALGE